MNVVGVKAVAGMSKQLDADGRGPFYLELFYNRKTCRVCAYEHYDLGRNTYTVFEDATDMIRVGNVVSPVTMGEIADMVADAVAQYDAITG